MIIFGYSRKAASRAGESVPPTIITKGFSFFAFPNAADITVTKPEPSSGIINSGTRKVVISVLRSRNASVNSLRYTIPMLRIPMSELLLWPAVRGHNLYEDLF